MPRSFEAREEGGGVGFGHPVFVELYLEVGVQLGDAARDDPGLGEAEVGEARAQAVEVGELELVEVGQYEAAAEVFLGDREGRFAAD